MIAKIEAGKVISPTCVGVNRSPLTALSGLNRISPTCVGVNRC